MSDVVLLQPVERWWRCPSCNVTDKTQRADAHTQMHPCAALGGINIPLIETQSSDTTPDGQHVAVEREEYIGDSGADRIAAIRTDHGDGSNDVTVLAPTARMKLVSY